jgi:hypothetical protein
MPRDPEKLTGDQIVRMGFERYRRTWEKWLGAPLDGVSLYIVRDTYGEHRQARNAVETRRLPLSDRRKVGNVRRALEDLTKQTLYCAWLPLQSASIDRYLGSWPQVSQSDTLALLIAALRDPEGRRGPTAPPLDSVLRRMDRFAATWRREVRRSKPDELVLPRSRLQLLSALPRLRIAIRRFRGLAAPLPPLGRAYLSRYLSHLLGWLTEESWH